MATRGRTLDPRHVEALNMIDLEFNGVRTVTDAWKAYLDHLTKMPQFPQAEGKDQEQKKSEKNLYESLMSSWHDKREDFLTDLLFDMGKTLNDKFDKTHIKRSIYSPQGRVDIYNEEQFLRKALIELLMGRINLPVLTKSPALSSDELEAISIEQKEQKLIRELLIKHYKGKIPCLVKVVKEVHESDSQ